METSLYAPEPQMAAVLTVEEVRVLIHRLAEDGSYLKRQAEKLLPENHKELAESMADTVRRFHDREMSGD